ncbi:MAG TPA: TusE/DsrC/DsvC family sulfur relay protein [Caldilineaceae bacterium]|nr:TusE/DsrC/DsvC family sulfur relay protein [Caldilineaceae bacterium]
MTTREIAGAQVHLNEEGFLTDPAEWNKEIAQAIATEEGVAELTPSHWKVIDFCRSKGPELNGKSPTLRQITNGTDVTTKELFKLFPKGPAKKVAKIAGLGKPEGCV